ncbi:hypothetical protein AC564_2675 [Lacticaseibacillus paracasei]|nr:hypothetical protein AC564_2675 [Lacticaseibacillus paracasei]
MQRFGFEQYGDPNVFETIEAPIPEPKTGQVQLQVLGFGLNPYDASLRRGEQAAFRKVKFPVVPGTDVLGRITKLGEGVTDFAIGDLVLKLSTNWRLQRVCHRLNFKNLQKTDCLKLFGCCCTTASWLSCF